MRKPELELDLGTVTMHCTTEEVAATLAALLREMRAVIPLLRPDEREVLRKIMSHEDALTVGEAFPGFVRSSEAHRTLRRLRAAQFVRPAKTGRWDPDERIEVKPFARLVWDRVGENVIFAGLPASPATAPAEEVEKVEETATTEQPAAEEEQPAAAEAAGVDDVVLDLRDVEEAKDAAEPAAARKSAGEFEDDNALDPNGDDLFAFAQEELRKKA